MLITSLVELIVLNIGLQAGILNNEVFAMFVVMALVTTFVTTPLTVAFYPEKYWRAKMAAASAAQQGVESDSMHKGSSPTGSEGALTSGELALGHSSKDEQFFRRRFVVVLERLESLPSMMAFVKMLQPSSHNVVNSSNVQAISQTEPSADVKKSMEKPEGVVAMDKDGAISGTAVQTPSTSGILSKITVDAFRLLALSDRTSALLRASETEVTKRADAILNIFSAFANLAFIPHTTSISIVPTEDYADNVVSHAEDRHADMLVVPWAAGTSLNPEDDGPSGNPFESIFGQQAVERSPQYANFVRRVFMESSSDVGLFLDRGAYHVSQANSHAMVSNAMTTRTLKHIYLPFHGGPDDRAALDFVVQLVANNPHMTATVARLNPVPADSDLNKIGSADAPSEAAGSTSPLTGNNQFTVGAGLSGQDTVYGAGRQNTEHKLASDTADNLALARYFPSIVLAEADEGGSDNASAPLLPGAMSRISLETISTSTPLKTTLAKMASLTAASKDDVLVVLGRSRRSAPSHRIELEQYLKEKVVAGHGIQTLGIAASSEVRKTLGDIGSAVVVSGEAGSVLIIQTAVKGEAYLKLKKGKHA